MKIICPSCGADFQLGQEQALGDGLQIKCPACLHVFMAYADGSTASVENIEQVVEQPASGFAPPPPPPPPPRHHQTSAPPPVPTVESVDGEDVFDFSFGSSISPPDSKQAEPDAHNAAGNDDFDFSFGAESATPSPPPKPPETSSSPLGNLFDDLDDLPQPKVADAELPKPKIDAELPGVRQEQQEVVVEEPAEDVVEQVGLQAPEFTAPSPESAPPPPMPVSQVATESKGGGPLYLVLGGLILLGMVFVGLYFGGFTETTQTVRKPVVAKQGKTSKPAVVPVKDTTQENTSTLAQITGFMNKLEQLEVNLKEEDPQTKSMLQLYSALACLQFGDHQYFCAAAKKAHAELTEAQQDVRALALRLSQGELPVRAQIKSAVSQNPKDAFLQLLAGYTLAADGELEEAVNHFATAYELNSELKQSIRISTEISIRRGDYEGADASLSHLEELIPSSFPAYYLRAKLEFERPGGDIPMARQALDKAIALPAVSIRRGDRALLYELRAKIFRRDGQIEPAIAALSKAARLNPENESLLTLLGSLYFSRNEYDPALMQIRQLEKDGKTTPQLLVLKADCYVRMGQKKKAVSIIKEAKTKYPKSRALLLFEGDLLTEDRNYNGAEKAYEAAIALNPNDVSIQLKLANLLMAQSKIEAAKALLEARLKITPNALDLLIGYARMRKQLGDIGGGESDYQSARTHYSAALKQNASLNEVRLEYIDVLLNLGEITKAGRELARIESAGHLKFAVAYLRGRVLAKESNHVEAVKSFKVAMEQYKEDPQFLVFMAESAFESFQYQQAMQLLEQARLIDNKRSDVYHLVGRTAYEQGQYDSAIRNLKQAIKLDGQNTGHRYWLARAHMSRNENKNAGKELDRIIREVSSQKVLNALECESFFLRAKMLRKEGLSSWARALRLLDRHIQCAPEHGAAYLVRGKIHADYRSLSKARKDFDRAGDLATAAQKVRVAAEAFFEAAQILKRERRFDKTALITLFQKAVTSDPTFAPPHRDLCTLFAQEQPRVAKTHCKSYLESAPNGLYATEVREVLRNL